LKANLVAVAKVVTTVSVVI